MDDRTLMKRSWFVWCVCYYNNFYSKPFWVWFKFRRGWLTTDCSL